ncbi:peptidylprolyl isomerase [Synechococcus sp. A15-28]|uniref:peptidylprolyl isomerase n=1 Tax=Synechococcus sp. A15-28 TaxID=1050638 RepID=UPI0016483DE1|nr:peptidylprolyl isomerase [Synechococcus sp. A15-28]QNI41280.1 peptidyl-prolyl cis-trans isomerase/ PpiC-type [Synechococcus sp. A15-28]
MEGGTTLPELRRAIGADGRTLLRKYNLLKPLVEQMITSEAIAGVEVSAEALEKAKLELLDQRGFETMEQWSEMLADLGRTDEEVIDRLERVIRRQEYIRERFAPKAEARFLERKNELDQVVYSLLRLANNFLARELYLQIESGESNFADLAKRYAEGPERNTNGIVGPVSMTQAHPVLVEKLRVAQPGVLLEPFRIADWWLVVRLERYSPATFTPEVSDRMCREMFDAWIEEETATTLSRLEGEFSDFSIS